MKVMLIDTYNLMVKENIHLLRMNLLREFYLKVKNIMGNFWLIIKIMKDLGLTNCPVILAYLYTKLERSTKENLDVDYFMEKDNMSLKIELLVTNNLLVKVNGFIIKRLGNI